MCLGNGEVRLRFSVLLALVPNVSQFSRGSNLYDRLTRPSVWATVVCSSMGSVVPAVCD